MSVFKRGDVYWYKFYFNGTLIRESAKTVSKTLAKKAEDQRRTGAEEGYQQRAWRCSFTAGQNRCGGRGTSTLAAYRLRHRSVTFVEYAVGHLVRVLGQQDAR